MTTVTPKNVESDDYRAEVRVNGPVDSDGYDTLTLKAYGKGDTAEQALERAIARSGMAVDRHSAVDRLEPAELEVPAERCHSIAENAAIADEIARRRTKAFEVLKAFDEAGSIVSRRRARALDAAGLFTPTMGVQLPDRRELVKIVSGFTAETEVAGLIADAILARVTS